MRSGGGSAYHANVPVPAAETAGVVLIDATAVVAGATLTAQGSGKIVIEDTTQAPLAPAAPATVESPATCTSPGTAESPEASDAPGSPEAGDAAEAPEASDAPEASKAPDADENSEDCQSSEGAGVPLSADTIAKIVAFLQSLFA
jgi:pyochelin synthetase